MSDSSSHLVLLRSSPNLRVMTLRLMSDRFGRSLLSLSRRRKSKSSLLPRRSPRKRKKRTRINPGGNLALALMRRRLRKRRRRRRKLRQKLRSLLVLMRKARSGKASSTSTLPALRNPKASSNQMSDTNNQCLMTNK